MAIGSGSWAVRRSRGMGGRPRASMGTGLRCTADGVRLRTFSFDQDWQAVHALWARCGPGVQFSRSDEPAEIRKKLGRDPDLFLVAEQDGKIVGAVMGGYDGRRG